MGKKAIKKKTAALRLGSWEDVNQSLFDLGHLTREQTRIADGYNQRIEELKQQCEQQLGEIMAAMDEHGEQIYLFTVAHLAELDGRSKTMPNGVVAFKKSSVLKLTAKVGDVIAELKKLGKQACIETKEKIKKAVLKQEAPEVLAAVGAKVVPVDSFRIELPDQTYDYGKELKRIR